jgi:hypothetical protein
LFWPLCMKSSLRIAIELPRLAIPERKCCIGLSNQLKCSDECREIKTLVVRETNISCSISSLYMPKVLIDHSITLICSRVATTNAESTACLGCPFDYSHWLNIFAQGLPSDDGSIDDVSYWNEYRSRWGDAATGLLKLTLAISSTIGLDVIASLVMVANYLWLASI